MNRTDIINNLIKTFKFKKYLEIGVDKNENFNFINIQDKRGVDPHPNGVNVTYKMESDVFFMENNELFDIIFIDGLHTEEQSYKDMINSMNCLIDGGFIVVHDCNPTIEYNTRPYEQYHGGEWNGQVYRGFIDIRRNFKDWNSFCVDTDYGVGIITQNKQIPFINKNYLYNLNISWDFFKKNKINLLGLISESHFMNLLSLKF
jgi:hypothetical protein